MNGSPSSVITLGFGTGTFAPVVGLVVTLGFGIGSQSTALIGQWSNVIQCQSANQRIECFSANQRIECK